MTSSKLKQLLLSQIFLFITLELLNPKANAYNISSNQPPIIDLNPIMISATRFFSEKSRNAENAIVYTSDDIKKMPARDLSEILNYVPGIDVKATNKFGQATSATIHGSETYHVLIMVDGILFNTQLSGQANPARIPVEHIRQIEIIKGAASSAWGSSLGGVINVLTKDVGDSTIPKGKFTSSFAEFSTTKNSLDLSGKIGELGYLLTGSYLETDGIKSVSDAQETKMFSKWAYPLGDEINLTASFGYSGAHVRDGVNPNNKWESKPYISRYGKLNLNIKKNNLNIVAAYKYNDQDITSDTFNASTGALTFSTVSKNLYQGFSFSGNMPIEDNILSFGADFDWHTLKSSNYLPTSKNISMQAPYINYSLRLDQWDINTGVRYDNNAQFGSQISPGMGVIYHFQKHPKTSVYGKISRAFNAPILLWLYNDDPSALVAPNPDLEAEHAVVYEVGTETHLFSSLNLKLDLFRADVKNAIATAEREGLYLKDNFKKIRRQGVEMSLHYNLNETFNFYGSGAFTDVENRETKKIVRDIGIARQSFTLGGSYKNTHGFKFNLHGYYNYWSSSASLEPNDQKFIFDAKLTQKLKDVHKDLDIEIFLNLYNITNSKYWSAIALPLPKRYFEGGFSIEF